MEEKSYRTWNEFKQSEYRRVSTFQLSIDELARDLYFDEHNRHKDDKEEEEEELNFDI